MTETKVEEGEGQTELKPCEGGVVGGTKAVTAAISPTPTLHPTNHFTVPKGEKVSIMVGDPFYCLGVVTVMCSLVVLLVVM